VSYLLWFAMWLLSAVPAVTCAVYYHRRLGTRRQLLKETLISLQLEDAYMSSRHGETKPSERIQQFSECFDKDVRAGLSPIDYSWPVSLTTVLGAIGWFLTFSKLYPTFTALFDPKSFLQDYFAFGFVGAFFAGILTVFDEFRTFNLDPGVFYAFAYRILFSSTAAYLAAQVVKESYSPLVAFGVGLFPVEKAWKAITDKTAQAVGAGGSEGEAGAGLASIQGLEEPRNRQRLVAVDISTVQALATADPFWVYLQTTFPLRTIVDMMDKAILYQYIGDSVKGLRTHGINGVIELVALVPLANQKAAYGKMDGTSAANSFFDSCDIEKLIGDLGKTLKLEPEELKVFIYNLHYDPMVKLLYDIWGRYLNAELAPRVPPLDAGQPASVTAPTQPAAPVEEPTAIVLAKVSAAAASPAPSDV
jgi:hypothetical protein